jgi:FHA domain/Double zinc ribbon
LLKCKSCGAKLDFTMSACPSCGAEVEMGRLTGILGVVCRHCDAYNEPGAKACASCGKPLGTRAAGAATTPAGGTPAVVASAGAPPEPGAPVVRTFPRAAPKKEPTPPIASPETPIPLVTACPSCGQEAGPGQFCAHCGQPLGEHGTQIMGARPPQPGQLTATLAFGAMEPGRAKLVLERGEGFDGAVFRLNAQEAGAGRSRGVILFPDDPCLAPLHATFFYRDGALHVRDEGAPGGIFLRLRGLTVPIKPGDLFAVGDRLLRYAGPLPPPPPPPPDGSRKLGSPRPPSVSVLVEEWLEGGVGGRVYLRSGPSVTLGRAGCSINLGDDPFLSQAHAEIVVDPDGTAKLRDLGSSNGTFVRAPPKAERELHDGDMLRMGREVLRVSIA